MHQNYVNYQKNYCVPLIEDQQRFSQIFSKKAMPVIEIVVNTLAAAVGKAELLLSQQTTEQFDRS